MNQKIYLLKNLMPSIISDIIKLQYESQPEFGKYGDKGYHYALEDAKYNIEYLIVSITIGSISSSLLLNLLCSK